MLRRATVTFVILVLYLSIWAVLKPPLQSPDEPQHLLRAAAVEREPWVSSNPEWLLLNPRILNPMVVWPPGSLGKLYFNGGNALLPHEVPELKAYAWTWLGPAPTGYATPLASYPPGYYGPLLWLGETTRAWIAPTPYQHIFVYRFWTLLMASVLWTLVYVVLRRLPETAADAELLLAFLLLNAMLAFVTSAVSPDGVNIPLATLAVLFSYRVLTLVPPTHEESREQSRERLRTSVFAALALLACVLTKPSGLLVFAGLCGGTALLWALRMVSLRQAAWGAIALIAPMAFAWLIFYAWSPLAFRASTPISWPLNEYLISLVLRGPRIAAAYWGKLGWRDYQLPLIWYAVLFALLALNAAFTIRAIRSARRQAQPLQPVHRFAIFGAAVFAVYCVLFAVGEYRYLPMAGLNFQGRHLLPAGIGLAGIVLHDTAWARRSLIAYLAIMNLAFMHASIVRYFGGSYSLFLQSLPFV